MLKFRLMAVKFAVSVMFFGLFGAVSHAEEAIVGDWETIDHKTNKPSSVIHIWESNHKFYGKIAKIFPSENPDKLVFCDRCRGADRGKPILGLTIITDFLHGSKNQYVNGRILDPHNGHVYQCYMRVIEQGQRLKVHGYFGIPILGRTDIWQRYNR